MYIYVDNRKVVSGSFNNSNFESLNVQGDNVNQINIKVNEKEKAEAFDELFKVINSLQEVGTREQAQYNAEILQEAIEEGNKTKAQRVAGFLQSTLGNTASLVAIAEFAGLTLSGLPII